MKLMRKEGQNNRSAYRREGHTGSWREDGAASHVLPGRCRTPTGTAVLSKPMKSEEQNKESAWRKIRWLPISNKGEYGNVWYVPIGKNQYRAASGASP